MTVEVRIRAEAEQDLAEAAQQTVALTVDQNAELDHRLDSIELDNNRGLLATDVVTNIRPSW